MKPEDEKILNELVPGERRSPRGARFPVGRHLDFAKMESSVWVLKESLGGQRLAHWATLQVEFHRSPPAGGHTNKS